MCSAVHDVCICVCFRGCLYLWHLTFFPAFKRPCCWFLKNPVVYILGRAVLKHVVVITRALDVHGFIAGSTRVGVIVGSFNITNNAHVIFHDLTIVSDSSRPVIDADEGASAEVRNSRIVRESTFNSLLTIGNVTLSYSREVVVSPGVMKFLKASLLGSIAGAGLYWAWLLPLLWTAGGPIAAGPASVVFGSMALGWSATMGTVAFVATGGVVVPAIVLAALFGTGKFQHGWQRLKRWWRS
eukprot:INCI2962.2.p1 GENE.INCI2962.2~~INCI2962.2.p1  ORF type:complete len:241 (-),score=30.47 INCI2962.2:492-1214(-)